MDYQGMAYAGIIVMIGWVLLALLVLASPFIIRWYWNAFGTKGVVFALVVAALAGSAWLGLKVWLVVKEKARVTAFDRELKSSLIKSVHYGASLSDIHKLIEGGADLNEQDPQTHLSALSIATTLRREDVVRLLLEQPKLNVHMYDSEGEDALFFAARVGCSLEILQLLHSRGLSIERKNKRGKSVLEIASGSDLPRLKWLLEQTRDLKSREQTLINRVRAGEVSAVRLILDLGISKAKLNDVFINAARELRVIGSLARSASPEDSALPPPLEALQLLLLRGASIQTTNSEGANVLHLLLQEAGSKSPTNGGYLPTVRFLVSKGLDFKQVDHAGLTPEFYLIRGLTPQSATPAWHWKEFLGALRNLGANFAAKDSEGKSIEQHARRSIPLQALTELLAIAREK